MPKRRGGSTGFLVAQFEKFPGVRIPLLSDDECKERGIESQRLPTSDWQDSRRWLSEPGVVAGCCAD